MRVYLVLPLLAALLACAAPLDSRQLHNADFSRGPAITPLSSSPSGSLAARAQSIVFNGVIQDAPGCKRFVSADTPLRVPAPGTLSAARRLNFNLNCDSLSSPELPHPALDFPESQLADLSLVSTKRQLPTLPLPLPIPPNLPVPQPPVPLATTKRQLPLPDLNSLPSPGLPVPVPVPRDLSFSTVDSDNL